MSKTVLLPDELYKQIQDTKIETKWVEIKMSIAKKIELYFDFYMLKGFLQKSPHIEIDLLNIERDDTIISKDWIPVSKKLPSEYTRKVLVLAYWIKAIAEYDHIEEWWLYNDEIADDWVITHWMSLPNNPE